MTKAPKLSRTRSAVLFRHGVERKQDVNEGIFRVAHVLIKDGRDTLVISDLIFDDGPIVVLEWVGRREMNDPILWRKLDPAQLELFEDVGINYIYRGRIEYPERESQKLK